MRVTFRAIDASVDAINVAAEQMARAREQVATGRRLVVASDDPGGALRAVEGHAEIGTLDAYTQSADTAQSRLTVLDGVLAALTDTLTEAQSTVAQVRGTTANQATREAVAVKLQGLRERVASFLNATFRGTYLFAGAKAQTAPYAQVAGAWVYQGDSQAVTVNVGRSRTVTTAYDGQAMAKGSAATDMLTLLDQMATAAQAGDEAALESGMTALAAAFDRVARVHSQVGADQYGIDEEIDTLGRFRRGAEARVSKDEAADMAKAITQLAQAQNAYEAALGAVGTGSKISLLNFLR